MTPAEMSARHPLATADGLACLFIVMDMMKRGVPSVERRWVLTRLRQARARWSDAWTEPGLR